MRLIDADALKALIDEGWGEGPFKTAFFGEIDDASTIDPVKHGKWIADKYTRKCSECESTYWVREGNAWNYCPNCGAKNGGEE